MVKEKIEKVLQAEKEARAIIEKANEDSLKIKDDANVKSDKASKEAVSSARKKAEEIAEENKVKIAHKISQLNGELDSEISEIENKANQKKDTAVKFILEKVMG